LNRFKLAVAVLLMAMMHLGGSGAAAAQATAQTQRDARLVGVWVNEKMLNSSGGGDFASFSTIMTMEFAASGRISQWTRSVGGGAAWSYDDRGALDFEGEWRADGSTFSVKGMGLADFVPAARYQIVEGRLVTQSDMGRLIWAKK